MIRQLQPSNIAITASIGIASLTNEHKEEFANLYQSAKNAALYSKKNGHNQVTADNQSPEITKQAEAAS